MSASLFACQKAVRLALTGLCGDRIYDGPPQTVDFPWIEIGDRQIIPDDTTSWSVAGGSDAGVSDFFDLHVWSRAYAGKKEVEDIVDDVHSRLHEASLAVVGRASALAWVRSVRILRDPDGITNHGLISLEVVHRS